MAEQLAYQTERTLKEHRDKLDESEASTIEGRIMELKGVLESSDVNEIKAKTEELQQASQKLAEAVYAQATAAAGGAGRRQRRLRRPTTTRSSKRPTTRSSTKRKRRRSRDGRREKDSREHRAVAKSEDGLKTSSSRRCAPRTRSSSTRSSVVKAEFDNYRKRAARDQESLVARAGERIVKELLPVLDDLERALEAAHAHEEAKLEEGVELVHRQLEQILDREGLVPVATDGKFDPHVHEALLTQPSAAEEGAVIEVLQKGYRLGDRVLRPARVVVAGPKEPDGDPV